MADMRGSTMLAEKEGREVYIDTLNQFFDAIAAPFNRAAARSSASWATASSRSIPATGTGTVRDRLPRSARSGLQGRRQDG